MCDTLKHLHCSVALSVRYRSKFVALHGNGDVSKWVKNFRVGRKTPNKQTHKLRLFVDYLTCKLGNHNQIIIERIGRLVGVCLIKQKYNGFSLRISYTMHTAYLKIDTVYLIQDDIYTEPRIFILHDTL